MDPPQSVPTVADAVLQAVLATWLPNPRMPHSKL